MFLIEWVSEVLKEFQRLFEENLGSGGPYARMQKQLRLLYGRGEIDQNTFLKLRRNLNMGYSIDGELRLVHRQSIIRLEAEGRLVNNGFGTGQSDSEIERSLDQLYINRAILEEVRLELKYALHVIETTGTWLQHQVETTYEKAQIALPNEEAARGFLELRHDLQERIQYLNQRSQFVHKNLLQVDALEAELGIYEAELILADTQEYYLTARMAIHH